MVQKTCRMYHMSYISFFHHNTGVTLSALNRKAGVTFLALILCFNAGTKCFVFYYNASLHYLSPLTEKEKETTRNVCTRGDCVDLHST